jgi:hypothetical protein
MRERNAIEHEFALLKHFKREFSRERKDRNSTPSWFQQNLLSQSKTIPSTRE